MLALLTSPVSHIYLAGFVLPAALLVGVGALDDAFCISYKSRFVAQILAGLLMIFAGGVMVEQLGALLVPGKVITLGVFAIPFTLVCLVGLVNAFNMSDGIDGLAGSLTLVTTGRSGDGCLPRRPVIHGGGTVIPGFQPGGVSDLQCPFPMAQAGSHFPGGLRQYLPGVCRDVVCSEPVAR